MGDKSIPNRDWSGTGRKEKVNGKQTLTDSGNLKKPLKKKYFDVAKQIPRESDKGGKV